MTSSAAARAEALKPSCNSRFRRSQHCGRIASTLEIVIFRIALLPALLHSAVWRAFGVA